MFSCCKRTKDIRSTLTHFTTTSNNLPIIDVSSFLRSAPNERTSKNHDKLIDELRDVGSKIGFFYITGFNDIVSQKLISDTLNESKKFFDLPLSDKMAIHTSTTPYLRGYMGIGDQGSYGFDLSDKRLDNMKDNTDTHTDIEEKLNDGVSTLGDLKEVFTMGTELAQTHKCFNDILFGENIFPNKDILPQFEIIMKEYYDSVLKLSNNLFELFSISMDKEYNYFDNLVHEGMNSMNVLRYIPKRDNDDKGKQDKKDKKEQFGIGEHTDYECFTILLQDVSGPSGLEILVNENENENENERKWQRFDPIENTFVVNFGDILARYSNDMFRSTVHRAVNDYNKSRYSIAFFRHCNFDTKVENLMINEKNKYDPVIAGQHMLDRVTRANQQLLSPFDSI